MNFKLGNHELPDFDGVSAVFGADTKHYPRYDDIPAEFRRNSNKFNRVVSALFFDGGSLAQHGLKVKDGVDTKAFHRVLRSLLSSFAPPHEVKEGTCAWLLSEYTEPVA